MKKPDPNAPAEPVARSTHQYEGTYNVDELPDDSVEPDSENAPPPAEPVEDPNVQPSQKPVTPEPPSAS